MSHSVVCWHDMGDKAFAYGGVPMFHRASGWACSDPVLLTTDASVLLKL